MARLGTPVRLYRSSCGCGRCRRRTVAPHVRRLLLVRRGWASSTPFIAARAARHRIGRTTYRVDYDTAYFCAEYGLCRPMVDRADSIADARAYLRAERGHGRIIAEYRVGGHVVVERRIA